jgi:hypothetical protein
MIGVSSWRTLLNTKISKRLLSGWVRNFHCQNVLSREIGQFVSTGRVEKVVLERERAVVTSIYTTNHWYILRNHSNLLYLEFSVRLLL